MGSDNQTSPASGDVVVRAEDLRSLVTDLFSRVGCSTDEAGRIARSLVDANLTGHDSHGVIRVATYARWLADGVQHADQQVTTVVDAGSLLVIDGHYGMGQTVGPQATQAGIDRCRDLGVAVVALRNAGHLGRIGEYAEIAAGAGLVSAHFVNVAASRLVAPFGAISRRMGTNPVAFGAPVAGRPPIIHDFATSVVAEGKATVALHGGKPLPADAMVEPDGTVSGEPSVLYGPGPDGRPNPMLGPGALRAMGEHKGSGLSVMCELLAGALTGTGTAGPAKVRFANGMLSLYVDPAAANPDDTYGQIASDYIDWFYTAEQIDADAGLRLPGDLERERREARERGGIPIAGDAWESIAATAIAAGIAAEQVSALVDASGAAS